MKSQLRSLPLCAAVCAIALAPFTAFAEVSPAAPPPPRREAAGDEDSPPPPPPRSEDGDEDMPPPPRDERRQGGEGRKASKGGERSSKESESGSGERAAKTGDSRGGERSGKSGERRGNRTPKTGAQNYTLEQAMSDNAQLHTIAFNGLAFITGDFGASTFIPPGKVCDYFGFQYMRDIDAAQKGHNPKFLNRVVGNVFKTLSDGQRKTFESLAREQAPQLEALARMRLPLIKAFTRELTGDIPAGSAGLDKAAVVRHVGDIFARDAELSWRRAEVMGKVAVSLTAEQKAYFAKMKFGDFNTWPETDDGAYKLARGTEKLINVAYMTYGSEFFSWYAGSVDADTYFCPERHGTYFGGFYMKDMPAMGKKDYDISTSVTGDSGKEFLDTLTEDQRKCVTGLTTLQRKALAEVAVVRRAISVELRKFLTGGVADKAKVVALGRRYGELDGEMSYLYTEAFAKVNRTLSAEQRAKLVKLRNLDGYVSAPAYLYSAPLKELGDVANTDGFFSASKSGGTAR